MLPVAAAHLRDVRPLGPGDADRLAALLLDLVAEGRVCAQAVEVKNRIALSTALRPFDLVGCVSSKTGTVKLSQSIHLAASDDKPRLVVKTG